MLSVSAREQTTGVQAQIEVKPSYGLDDETITQMLRDSMNNAKDDAAARARAEAKVEAESLIGAIQAALDLDADLLSEEELNKINQLMTKLASNLETESAENIRTAVHELSHETDDFAARRMDRNIQRVLGGVNVADLS